MEAGGHQQRRTCRGQLIRKFTEQHSAPIYCAAFNQIDATQFDVFATIGANYVNIYRIEPCSISMSSDIAGPSASHDVEGSSVNHESPAEAIDGQVPCNDPAESEIVKEDSQAAPKAPRRPKGKRKRNLSTASSDERVVGLQSYQDDDPEERLYAIDWGAHPSTCDAMLAVAGEQRQIKVIDCHNWRVHSVLQGHGSAIHEVRFHPIERNLIFSASQDESIRLWDIFARDCIAIFSGEQVRKYVFKMELKA